MRHDSDYGFSRNYCITLLLSAFSFCGTARTQSSPGLHDTYNLEFVTDDEVKVSAQLLVTTSILVMDGGSSPDTRSANVTDLQVTSLAGNPIIASYEPRQGSWKLAISGNHWINLSYMIHLNSLRALPTWARLQYGFFDGRAKYLVMKGLIVAPDSTESTAAASLSFLLPQQVKVAAPWRCDKQEHVYNSTIAKLVNNSIVVGRFTQISYDEGGFSITAVLLGQWPAREAEVKKVIQGSATQNLRLFPGTPRDKYLVTLASGDEDGQSFTTSNAISTRLAISREDTEIWANTIAHELFHHWNARLIHTNDKRMGFFVEGFTEYYANREILAESLIDQRRYWNMAAFHLGAYSYFEYSPNYRIAIADAGRDKTKNRFGVYDAGWTLALCLDLQLRRGSLNRHTLSDVMRLMWQLYGLTGMEYTYEDFVRAVSQVAGQDMDTFFEKFVNGTNELPFRNVLAWIGVAAFDQPFGGEAYLAVKPISGAEKLLYRRFMSNGRGKLIVRHRVGAHHSSRVK